MRNPLTVTGVALGLSLASDAAAQQTIVSPISATSVEGASSNAFPWNSPIVRRYLQVHSDIKGVPKLIRQLAWRREGLGAITTATRAVDLELYMGDSLDFDRASFVIAQNYLRTPTQVLVRQVINLGPLVAVGTPCPVFEMVVPLPQLYVYIGVDSLAWEAVVYSNSVTGAWPQSDAELATISTGAGALLQGAGCVASGQSMPMFLGTSHADSAGTYAFGCYLLHGPAAQPVVLAIGARNPSVSVPGLCGRIYTDLAVVASAGITDASGALRNVDETVNHAAPGMIFSAPNTFAGASLYLQAHAFDPGSTSPIQIVNSDGRQLVVPTPNLNRVVAVTRVFNNSGGTTATHGAYFSTSAIGYGLVTEFTY